MARKAAAEIYMMKKSAQGVVVAFRLGARHGLRPNAQLQVVNEDGIPVGSVRVISSSEDESEALVAAQGGVTLGCRVRLPNPGND